jgi:hypothetical protein
MHVCKFNVSMYVDPILTASMLSLSLHPGPLFHQKLCGIIHVAACHHQNLKSFRLNLVTIPLQLHQCMPHADRGNCSFKLKLSEAIHFFWGDFIQLKF